MLNLKKIISMLAVIILLQPTVTFGQSDVPTIDKSKIEKGLVSINYKPNSSMTTKIIINKDEIRYIYDLNSNNNFSLQLGNGKYTVSILENVIDNKYRLVEKEEINLQLADSKLVFLQSTQIINWNENMEPIKKAKELTKNAKNDKEKVEAIYSYIVKSIKYDHNKAKNVKGGYTPSIESTFSTLNGICYDYSALFAAMLRSVEVPTKLIMGYKNDIETYHAWNEVYINDIDQWVTIDTTYDAAFTNENKSSSMIKDDKEYTIEKQY